MESLAERGLTEREVQIEYTPLPWTSASSYDMDTGLFRYDYPGFHNSNARFRVVVGGRRVGKGSAGAPEIQKAAWQRPASMNWWIAPIYRQARVGYKFVKAITPDELIKDESKVEMYIKLINDSELFFLSADNEDGLRSEGVDFAVCDELAMWKMNAWEACVWPALLDKAGRMVGLTTPKGRNFVFNMFTRGQDPLDPDWASWQFPTYANTGLVRAEIDNMTSGMNELVFNQEIMAEFIADAGGVFRNHRDNVYLTQPETAPIPGHQYFIGVDWGKRRDFSVFVVLDMTNRPRRVVAYERFSQIEYNFQLARLRGMINHWKPLKVKAEQNSVGDPLIENLRRDLPNIWVEGINVQSGRDGGSKARMIEKLMLDIERGHIIYPDWPEFLSEADVFEYSVTRSGNLKYGAPSGCHDDTIMAVSFANEEEEYVEPKITMIG